MEWRELPRWVSPHMVINTWKGVSDVAFLDSSDNVNPYGRHSILGFEPFLHLIYKNGTLFLDWKDGERISQSDLWGTIRDLLARYQICEPFSNNFPADERFGITSQIRRAAVSISTNIAEGCGRGRDTELARFLQIASGSASEVEYLLLLAKDLNYLPKEDYDSLHQQTVEIKRMLTGFMKRLRQQN